MQGRRLATPTRADAIATNTTQRDTSFCRRCATNDVSVERDFSEGRMFQVTSSLDFRTGARLGAALLFMAALFGACSQKPESLADYIAAICAKAFRSASSAEKPYLIENI